MKFKKAFEKSSNPMFNENRYKNVMETELTGTHSSAMTVQGAINKTFLLMLAMLAAAAIAFMYPSKFLMWTGIIGGAIVYFITAKNPSRAPLLAPVFAVLEGLLVGTATNMYWYFFDAGMIFKAVTLTTAILFMMLTIFKAGWIQVTDKFRAGVSMAVGAVMLFYLINIVCYFIGINIPFLHEGGLFSIGITLVIIGIASLNLLLDFDNFEKGEAMKAPDYMEWFFAMGLVFTLIWLYLEILRLLSYLSSD